jgi:hypothetical protein
MADDYKSLKETKADREARDDALGMPGEIESSPGADLHLEGHHLDKMGLPHDLPHGHKVELHFKGHVHRTDNSEGPEGEHHRMHVKLTEGKVHKGGDLEEKQSSLREDLEKGHKESEDKREKKESARAEKREEKDEKSTGKKGKDE